MATHNICFFNKYGFCKFLERCRRYHENKICEKLKCEKRESPLRHPKVGKFYRDLGFCKFSECVVVALEIAIEAFEELSDTAISFIEDTLVLQEKGTMT